MVKTLWLVLIVWMPAKAARQSYINSYRAESGRWFKRISNSLKVSEIIQKKSAALFRRKRKSCATFCQCTNCRNVGLPTEQLSIVAGAILRAFSRFGSPGSQEGKSEVLGGKQR